MARSSFINAMFSVARELERSQIAALKYRSTIEKEKLAQDKEEALLYAKKITDDADEFRESIQSILIDSGEYSVDFNKCLDKKPFKKKKPILEEENQIPEKPILQKPRLNILEHIFKSLREKKIKLLENKYDEEVIEWELLKKDIENYNANARLNNKKAIENWENELNIYNSNQQKYNESVIFYSKTYYQKNKQAVEFYVKKILSLSKYPDYFPKEFDLEYESENSILIIDYSLPLKNNINNLKQLKYVASRKEFKETFLKDAEIDKVYDNVLYQICLRVTYEVYLSDSANVVKTIVFNGWLTDVNRSTGNEETKCILSLLTTKSKFMEINIHQVDPKLCFKNFKGRSSAKLSELVPVAPIVNLDKEDKRFVESYSVVDRIDGLNIASIDWKDFENLIRELFEKEFCEDGTEIKITQASRDGGVDAVMFDPDPIKGGKIVIQAKRYTNIVGVSAVRDLYGTVVNEGATKGILITTSNYGSDSYEFAKDKPLTLLNGSNLLHLLEKNGYKAYIDILEAKKILNA